MKTKLKTLLSVFGVFFRIGAFTFGGGYAMIPLIQKEAVEKKKWITDDDILEIIAIAESTPGPIAINCATYVGYSVTGTVWGSLLATVAVCLPSLTLMLLATKFYLRLRDNRQFKGAMSGMQPMMIGLILSSAFMLFGNTTFIDWKSWVIFVGCFIASVKRVNPILLILLSAVVGIVLYA